MIVDAEEIVDIDKPFLEIEPMLKQAYGSGLWVVYSDIGLFLFRTAGLAFQCAHKIDGGKLVCCIGYGLKVAFEDFMLRPRW